MINKLSMLIPSDLCGVWIVRVFHLYGGFKHKCAMVGNFVKASARRVKSRNFIKKKKKSVSIILRSVYSIKKLDGSNFKFRKNNCVLLKRRMTPRGDFLYGPVPIILKRRKFITTFANKI